MGKQTHKKKVGKRPNPLATSQISNGMAEIVPKEEEIIPILQKLSSSSGGDRAWATAGISNLLVANAPTRKLLLSKGVATLLIERLTDPEYAVVQEALGALRNLTVMDDTIAPTLFAADILTPISALIPKVSIVIHKVLTDEPEADEEDKEMRKGIWDFAENLISIMWCLSEASENHLKSINRLNIITFLISFMTSADKCPLKVVVAAGQCLNTLTDDNKDIYIEFQNHPEYIDMLVSIVKNLTDEDKILVRILACATLLNVREAVQSTGSWDEESDPIAEMNKSILPILVEALNFDIEKASDECIQAVNSGNLTKDDQTGEISAKPKQPLTSEDELVQRVQERLTTLQLALELISNICIQDNTEDDGWEDGDATMEDDEEVPEEALNGDDDELDNSILEDMAATGETSNTADLALLKNNPILHMLIHQVFPQLIKLGTTTKISYPPQETPAKYAPQSIESSIIDAFSNTHLRAIECLNNFLLTMNDLPSKFWFKEKKEDAQNAWTWLFQTAGGVAGSGVAVGDEEPGQELRGAVLEAIVGCLWALARGLGQDIVLQGFHVPALQGAYSSCARDSLRVKCVGALGVISMRQGDIETNKNIGDFFIKALKELPPKGATTTDAATEILNALFDVYGDCAFDYDLPVFVNGGYLSALKSVLPAYKNVVKATDKRKFRDLRLRADEALGNLNAFIRYKTDERK
ncbi:hypothetical protein INT44_000732 [Umbelopsis vinacea]|uniref:SYO1-like TPR repeats domain-containing protein n=1 Tax=Umbelopsis vinacea TaxID=44442 RepID=A0A8H7Q8I7_9FUNG|nr:hypothetical protein INT44_000732 [Umbelopsis vinacea]